MTKGPLIILSGPSGCGKTVLLRRLLARRDLPLRVSVSATTRQQRDGERKGVDYHFLDPEVFEREVREGAFLESARVHGCCYGTLRREVDPYLERGMGVILVIDVQGAAQVRQSRPEAVSIFLRPPSLEELERRLRERGTESEEAIQRRLVTAQTEMARIGEYQYRVVNDNLERAVQEVHDIIRGLFQANE
jgi:guanylate kinase